MKDYTFLLEGYLDNLVEEIRCRIQDHYYYLNKFHAVNRENMTRLSELRCATAYIVGANNVDHDIPHGNELEALAKEIDFISEEYSRRKSKKYGYREW